MNNIRKKIYHPDIVNTLRVVAMMFVFLLHGRSRVEGVDGLTFLTRTPAWAGVWIFLLISSYLMGVGFVKGKYTFYNSEGKFSIAELGKFYLWRYIKLAVICYFYCFAFEYFTGQGFMYHHPKTAWHILTFTFNGTGGVSGIGHLWYLSLAMQIYLIFPVIYWMLSKIKKPIGYKILLAAVLAIGLITRIVLQKHHVNWDKFIYTNIVCNLDIIFSGALLAFIKNGSQNGSVAGNNIIMNIIFNLQFALLVIFNCKIYYVGTDNGIYIYRYILPTVYIISCSLLIYRYHDMYGKRDRIKIRQPLAFIDWFAPYTFAFYVLHIRMFNYFTETFGTIPAYINAPLANRYFIFFGTTFLFTLAGGVILTYAVAGLIKWITKPMKFLNPKPRPRAASSEITPQPAIEESTAK